VGHHTNTQTFGFGRMPLRCTRPIFTDDDVLLGGAESPGQTDADSSVQLQPATWQPANQRRSDSLLKQTDLGDDRPVTEFHHGDAHHPSSVNSTHAIQTSGDRWNDDICHLSSVSSTRNELRSVGSASQISSTTYSKSSGNARGTGVRGGRHRGGRRGLSDLNSLSSATTCAEFTRAILEQHPRRSWAGLKRKSSTGKSVLNSGCTK